MCLFFLFLIPTNNSFEDVKFNFVRKKSHVDVDCFILAA